MKTKKYISTILFFVLFSCCSQGKQEKGKQYKEINLKEYYSESGIIFNKEYAISSLLKNIKYRYSPDIEDVKKAEDKFFMSLKAINSTNNYSKWVRQYVGYIDKNENKNIVISFINNSQPRKVVRLLGKNWKWDYVEMLSDEFYKINYYYVVNIDIN